MEKRLIAENPQIDSFFEENEKASIEINQIIEALRNPNADYLKIIESLMHLSQNFLHINAEVARMIGTFANHSSEILDEKQRIEKQRLMENNYSDQQAKENADVSMKITHHKEQENQYAIYGRFINKSDQENIEKELAAQLDVQQKQHALLTQEIKNQLENQMSEEPISNEEEAPTNSLPAIL